MRNVFDHLFKQGKTFTRYFRVQQNEIELEDSAVGFLKTVKEFNFLDIEFSPYFSELEEDSEIILESIFETSNLSLKYERQVWNLEEALG